jgi:hypothetical protein
MPDLLAGGSLQGGPVHTPSCPQLPCAHIPRPNGKEMGRQPQGKVLQPLQALCKCTLARRTGELVCDGLVWRVSGGSMQKAFRIIST